jgi:GR25 family glycosyltransferase involved in LPS biosynthesis
MDILIKSYNRPYYLDRCIQSIYLNCKGNNFTIKVLDDGTPDKYLNKIQKLYPEIIILKSEHYNDKSRFCEQGSKPENMIIPIDFWVSSVSSATDYFILLEDDIWFTEKFELNAFVENMIQNKSIFTKLFWLGNPKLIQYKVSNQVQNLTFFEPNLYVRNPLLFTFIFYKFNRFKIRKLLILLKIHTSERYLNYYSIYSVAGAIFKKDYFLSLWKYHKNTVDEGLQLFNAVTYFNKNKERIAFSHTHSEVLKTGFLSSATNQFKEFDVLVDMFVFNKIINEAWYENELNVMDNYPNDIPVNVIKNILKAGKEDSVFADDWEKWVLSFKNQYVNFGCKID